MVKLGLVRFSLLLASALVMLAMLVQMVVILLLSDEVASIDVVRSVFFGLLITLWAVYFLSVVVEQFEGSRQRLALLRFFRDASPDLVYYRNGNNEFSGCNRVMELLTGKGKKQLIGLKSLDVYRQ